MAIVHDSQDADVDHIHDYFSYDVKTITEGVVTLELSINRPSVFDPSEIVIKGEFLDHDKKYVYIVEVNNKDRKLYKKIFECERPWDFFEIRRDFEGENDLYQQLNATAHPFELRMKNDSWSFIDEIGSGWSKVLKHTLRCFWTTNKKDLFHANLVQAWENLVEIEIPAASAVRSSMCFLAKTYLDHLRTLHKLCQSITDQNKDAHTYFDFEYLNTYLEELLEIRERIFKVVEIRAKERNDLLENQGLKDKIDLFYRILDSISNIADNSKTQNVSSIYASLPDPLAIKSIVLNISDIMQVIIHEDIELIKAANVDITDKILKINRDDVIVHTEQCQTLGLAWRSNLFFFNLLKRSLFDRLISTHLPRYRSVVIGNTKNAVIIEDNCYFRIKRHGYTVTLLETDLRYRKLTESDENDKVIPLPCRLPPTQYKLTGDRILMNLRNRGLRNWGMALFQIDFEPLRYNEDLSISQLKGYDVPVTYSYDKRILNLVYIKGLACNVGIIQLDYDPENKTKEPKDYRQLIIKARELFKLNPASGDKNPELKDIEWKHITMSSGVVRGVCIYQITHYESETAVSQRLLAYHYKESVGMIPLSSLYREFPREYFDGRRVEPRHHSIFGLKRVPFCMICSDRMNYHLTAFTNNQFITVMSWSRPKRILLGWKTSGIADRVFTAWDEKNDRMCLYSRTTKCSKDNVKADLQYGLLIMQVKLKF